MVARAVLDSHDGRMAHRGPERPRHVLARRGRARRRGGSASSTSRAVTSRFANEAARVWAIQNGELYNHASSATARADGHRSAAAATPRSCRTSTSDDGRLPAAAPRQVRHRRLGRAHAARVLARDRLGVKPLYYADVGDLLVFASELKSVLASGLVDAELDYEAIDAYLTLGYFPAPATPLAGVAKLLPGHLLVVDDGRVHERALLGYPPAPERR